MFNIGLVFSLPFITLLLFEFIYRGSLSSTLDWIMLYPSQFMVTYAIIFGLVNFFYILPRRFYLTFGMIFISFFCAIGLISRQKLLLRGEPLVPWDFRLGKEALTISQSFEGNSSPDITAFFIVILLACITLFGLFFVPKEKYIASRKIPTAVLSVVLFLAFTHYIPLVKTFSFEFISWSQKLNYEENGMTLGFILNSKNLLIDQPGDYQEPTVNKIIGQASSAYTVNPDFAPNVIFVMSEAFWDPTIMENVTFSEDPLPYFRSLQQKYSNGVLLTPVYGGGTANTEFEVLTGLSTQFLPKGLVPYVQFVHKPLEALPAIFKRQGYEATAIHTYDNWFYRRNVVYQDLGFDRFISKEFFSEPEYYGPYIRDTEISHKILSQLKQTDNPDFIYAVSMQAHGPYSTAENPDNRIKINGNFTPQTHAILENYTNTISDVDQSLKILIEGLKKVHEPTLVVFFGDHLPMLGNDFDVYREAGFFEDENTYTGYMNKYSVPIVVWNNFSRTKEDLRLSANFLGSYVLELSKKEGSPLTDFLSNLKKKGSHVVTCAQYLDQEKISDEELSQYRLLQYDFLLGNEYVYQLKPLHRPISNPIYTLGDSSATIVEVLTPDEKTIEVLGSRFSQNHQIYVNNKPISTNFVDDTLLIATLPELYVKQQSSLAVQVKLKDSMKNVISESNIFSREDDLP